jgi:hypothetical protein
VFIEQQVIDQRLELETREEELAAVRSANRGLMAQLNGTPARRITAPRAYLHHTCCVAYCRYISLEALRIRDFTLSRPEAPPENRLHSGLGYKTPPGSRHRVPAKSLTSRVTQPMSLSGNGLPHHAFAQVSHPFMPTKITYLRNLDGSLCCGRTSPWVGCLRVVGRESEEGAGHVSGLQGSRR